MSLWTPHGEHEVPRDGAGPEPQPPPDDRPSLDDLSDEERAQAEALAAQMAEVREQLANTPAAVVVANHAMGLYELAAIHLQQDPPRLEEAQVAIDGMGGLVEALPGRLGENEATLQEALHQLRMAFVQVSQQTGSEG